MFSQTVEYALRAIVYLAQHQEPRTTQQIAETTRVPAAYLSKVLQNLNRGGLVVSQRGLYGGCSLARSDVNITLWDIVQSVEPIQRILTCPLGIEGHGADLCPLHRRMDDTIAATEAILKQTTVASLLGSVTNSIPFQATIPIPILVTPPADS